jgi:hypothetical protein
VLRRPGRLLFHDRHNQNDYTMPYQSKDITGPSRCELCLRPVEELLPIDPDRPDSAKLKVSFCAPPKNAELDAVLKEARFTEAIPEGCFAQLGKLWRAENFNDLVTKHGLEKVLDAALYDEGDGRNSRVPL